MRFFSLGQACPHNLEKKKNKMNKAIMVVIALVLGIGVFIILGRGFSYLLGQSDVDLSSSLASTGDYDEDGILDAFDGCPCHEEDGESDVIGCDADHPDGYSPDEKAQCESDRSIH